MYSKNELNKIIKQKVKDNEFEEASEILKSEIKQIFVDKIKKCKKNYKYTDITNLGVSIEKYLPLKFLSVYQKFYILLNEENHPLYEVQRLIELYNKIGEE